MRQIKFRALWILAHLGFGVFLRNTARENMGFVLLLVAFIAFVSGLDAGNDLLTCGAVILGFVAFLMAYDAAQRMMQ